MKYLSLFFLSIIFIFSACSNPESSNTQAEKTVSTPKSLPPTESLPSIPLALMEKLYQKCNHVDYLFYETNFSMSMDNQPSIQSTLTHISENVPNLNLPCKSIGRIFYEIDGNIEIEAEIYFSNDCQHFVFMKNNKRIYSNNITAAGVQHFNNIFKQASQMSK